MYAEPGNTACSGDALAKAPFRLQWFGEPGPSDMVDRHHRTVVPLYCNGRLFIPGNERVFAVDAYNGTMLWSREVPGFRRIAAMRDCGNMAVADNRLFVVAGRTCTAFDAQTGKPLSEHIPPPGSAGLVHDWGYVAVLGDCLYGSGTRPGASRGGHSRAAIGDTYWDRRPIVTSTCVFCQDSRTAAQMWLYQAKGGAILNPTLTIGGGRMYFVESSHGATLDPNTSRSTPADLLGKGSQLVALDVRTGNELWRKAADFAHIEHHLYLSYAQERLVAVGSRNHRASPNARPTVWYDVHTFRATDGEPLWRQSQDNRQGAGGDHGEQDHHPAIVGRTVYVEPLAYDLQTGRRIESWKYVRGGHGCGTLSASADALFFRAGNPTMCDLATGTNTKLTRVTRPGCWINIIPAGGLVLIPEASSGCTCNFSIQTSLALVPASVSRQ
jgi:outer membrane protein assembly factor BamB